MINCDFVQQNGVPHLVKLDMVLEADIETIKVSSPQQFSTKARGMEPLHE